MRLPVPLAAGLAALALAGPSPAGAAPEGKVAYLGEVDGTWQVFVMAPDGGGARQLTTSPGDKTRACWYPGGDALLVSRATGGPQRVDAASGAETDLPLGAASTLDAALSPDGKTVAYSISPAQTRDQNEIFVVGIDGSGRKKLTHRASLQHQPTWSPDGTALYYLSGPGGGLDHDVFRMVLATGESEQLTAGSGFHFDAAAAPDGALAFASNRSGNYEIWVLESAGTPRAVTADLAADGAPSWSPDGAALLFESSRGGRQGLWRVARTGGAAEPIPTPTPARRPVWWHPRPGEVAP